MISTRPAPRPPSGPDPLRSAASVVEGPAVVVPTGDQVAERLRRGQAALIALGNRLGDTTGST